MLQSIKKCILSRVSLRRSAESERWFLGKDDSITISAPLMHLRCGCSSTSTSSADLIILDKVIRLVKKKYDKIEDAAKVTDTADFQKDLSLDRVELIMAVEEEFSIEIPDDKADKLTCCAHVAKYILASQSGPAHQ